MPNYDALTAHLRAIENPVVVMSFTEIDRVVGALPPSARQYNAWWANSTTAQRHARAWLNARRTASVDLDADRVTFTLGTHLPGGPPTARPLAPYRNAPAPPTVVPPPTLTMMGEAHKVELSYAWRVAGAVTLASGRLKMPVLGVRPGIYRFEVSACGGSEVGTYIGESDNLERRMGNYRNPGPTQPTNLRLNQLLKEALEDGGSVVVSVVLEAIFDGGKLDLAARPARLLVENAALLAESAAGAARYQPRDSSP
jgi:hypothetical protein